MHPTTNPGVGGWEKTVLADELGYDGRQFKLFYDIFVPEKISTPPLAISPNPHPLISVLEFL